MFVPKAEQTEEDPEGRHWGAFSVSCALPSLTNYYQLKDYQTDSLSVLFNYFNFAFRHCRL